MTMKGFGIKRMEFGVFGQSPQIPDVSGIRGGYTQAYPFGPCLISFFPIAISYQSHVPPPSPRSHPHAVALPFFPPSFPSRHHASICLALLCPSQPPTAITATALSSPLGQSREKKGEAKGEGLEHLHIRIGVCIALDWSSSSPHHLRYFKTQNPSVLLDIASFVDSLGRVDTMMMQKLSPKFGLKWLWIEPRHPQLGLLGYRTRLVVASRVGPLLLLIQFVSIVVCQAQYLLSLLFFKLIDSGLSR